MTSPICDTWLDADDLDGTYTDEVAAEAVQVASEVLYRLSGHRWPGTCTDTFRPTHDCGQGCPGHTIDLGLRILSVEQVLIDGEALAEGEYEVREGRYLVRLPDADDPDVPRRWPCRQVMNLPDTEDGTWSIRVVYGGTPPPSGVRAARSFAEELAKARAGADDCRLPERVTSVVREGVSMEVFDPEDFLTDGRVGIYDVDLFLGAVNPHRLRSRPRVINPDRARERIRTSDTVAS